MLRKLPHFMIVFPTFPSLLMNERSGELIQRLQLSDSREPYHTRHFMAEQEIPCVIFGGSQWEKDLSHWDAVLLLALLKIRRWRGCAVQ